MHNKLLNYIARSMVIVIGVIFLTGVIEPMDSDTSRFQIMGVVFILFGIYRIVLYRLKTKQYDFSIRSEELEEEKQAMRSTLNNDSNEEQK